MSKCTNEGVIDVLNHTLNRAENEHDCWPISNRPRIVQSQTILISSSRALFRHDSKVSEVLRWPYTEGTRRVVAWLAPGPDK